MAEDGTFNADFAQWYRSLELSTDDAMLKRRRDGVAALLKQATSPDVEALVRVAFRTKQVAAPEHLTKIRQAFKSADDDFPLQGNDRELQLLCAAALTELSRKDGDVAATAAVSVSTASACGSRRPELPLDLVRAAESAIGTLSDGRRSRPALSALKMPEFPKAEFDKAPAKVKAQPDMNAVIEALGMVGEATKLANASMWKQFMKGIGLAETFIAVQDEELQMLWWLVGERSWDRDCPFTQLPIEERVLVLSKELAKQTAFLPGPRSVQALLSRASIGGSTEVTIADCVNACAADWLTDIASRVMSPSPVTQPIHTAIKGRVETGERGAWIGAWAATTGLDATKKHSPLVLATHFYRERLLAAPPGSPA